VYAAPATTSRTKMRRSVTRPFFMFLYQSSL
jgi:hypothetical protein